MTRRTSNIVVSFMDADVTPAPMYGNYNVSLQGYVSPDSPYRCAHSRLKGSVTIDKKIGCVMWKEGSGVEFGNIDIDVSDGGDDLVNGTVINWIEWAATAYNPQVVIAIELADGTLEHIATADARDVFYLDDNTIRVALEVKHGQKLSQPINLYYDGVSTDLDGSPIPIYWGAGGYNTSNPIAISSVIPTVIRDSATLRYDVTDLDFVVTSPSAYAVYDRGIQLNEGESPGFTLTDNGIELTANPDGKITLGMAANDGGGVEDPLESGELLQGPWRIIRLMLERVDIDWSTHYPDESAFDDLDLGAFGYSFPIVSYTETVSAEDAINRIMDSVGGWFYVDEMADFQFGRVTAPEDAAPVASYTDTDMIGRMSAVADRAPGLSTRAHCGWRPGYYSQEGLAGNVTDFMRDRVTKEWITVTTTESIPTLYAAASGVEPMDIYATQTAPAQTELDRRWELYDSVRRFWTFTVPLWGNDTIPNLGDTVLIQSDNFGLLENPLAVYVRRVKMDLTGGLLTMEAWGGNPALTPSVPASLTATAVSGSQIDLAWVNTATNATGIKVQRSATGTGGWSTIDTVGPAVNTYEDTGLSTGTTYYYRVIATNANGDSAPSNVDSATPSNVVWEYATLAIAEASGDPWSNEDTIRITNPDPDVDFTYYTTLDTDGHSGLIHKYPFGDTEHELDALTFAVSGDPDGWGGDWVDSAAFETKDVDGSGRSRLSTSTTPLKRYMHQTTNIGASENIRFGLLRDWYMSAEIRATQLYPAFCYADGSNSAYAFLQSSGAGSNYQMVDDSGTNTIAISRLSRHNIYFYIRYGDPGKRGWSVWVDEAMVDSGGVITLPTIDIRAVISTNLVGAVPTNEHSFDCFISGSLTES